MDKKLIATGTGFLVTLISILCLIRQIRKSADGYKNTVKAKVIEIKERVSQVDSDRGSSYNVMVYAPVYEFYVDGIQYHVCSSLSTNYQKYQIGDEEMIGYDPEDPRKIFTRAQDKAQYVLIIAFLFAGIAVLAAGLWMM